MSEAQVPMPDYWHRREQVLSPFGFSTYYWFLIGRLNTLSFGRTCNPTACVRMGGISLPDLSFGRICNPTAWNIGICNPESPLMPALQMPIFASGGLQIRQNRKGQAPNPKGDRAYCWFFIGKLNTLPFGRICNPTV